MNMLQFQLFFEEKEISLPFVISDPGSSLYDVRTEQVPGTKYRIGGRAILRSAGIRKCPSHAMTDDDVMNSCNVLSHFFRLCRHLIQQQVSNFGNFLLPRTSSHTKMKQITDCSFANRGHVAAAVVTSRCLVNVLQRRLRKIIFCFDRWQLEVRSINTTAR